MPDYLSGAALQPTAPNLTKAQKLKRSRERITFGREWLQTSGHTDTWKRLVDLYRGKHFTDVKTNDDRIAVNYCFQIINTIGPSVATNYPKITVNARKEEFDAQAAISEAVLNYWWRHYDFKPEFRRAVDDWLIIGHGWLKTCYRYQERVEQRDPQELAAEFQHLDAQVNDYAIANPHMAGDLPTPDQVASLQDQTKLVPTEDRPAVERVSPFDMLVDPEATCLADARWLAQRMVRPLEEVKKDSRYPAAARNRLKPDGATKREALGDKDERRREDVARVTLWEFYDLVAGTVAVFADTGEDFLVGPQDMPYTYGHPFVMLRNYDVPDEFYPIGELEMLEPMQHELNKTRSQLMSFRRKQARKHLYRKSAFGPEGQRALASDADGEMVPVETDDPFDNIIAPLRQEAMDAQLYTYSDVITHDIDRISGVSEYMSGQLPELRRTATEASIIQDAANARASDKLAIVESVTAEVAERLLALAQTYLTGEHVARIVGPNGKQLWVPFQREDITGEFDFEVEAGSTQPRNETFRRQQALQLMNTLQPFIGTFIDPIQILQHVLRDGYGIKNPEQYLIQTPPQPKPSEKLVETIAYKDVPPDIQRQMEQQAGFMPSQLGGSSPIEAQAGMNVPTPPPPGSPPPPTGPAGPQAPAAAQLEGQVGLTLPSQQGVTPGLGGGALGPGSLPAAPPTPVG